MLAQPLTRPSGGRIAAYAGLFLLGAVIGAAGALVQPGWFPLGLLLALAGAAGLFLGGSRATGTRAGAVAPAAGFGCSPSSCSPPAARKGTSSSAPGSVPTSSSSEGWPSL